MASYESYTSTLTQESAKKARDELNEKPEENRAQLKQLIDWIKQQQAWLTVPTDPVFLISFLRARKFSQLLARETLVNYITTRQRETDLFQDVSSDDPKVSAILKTGFFLPLPKRDKHGRQICLVRPGKLDISGKVYRVEDVFRTIFMIFDMLLRNEDIQVNGFVLLIDYTGVTIRHTVFASREARARFIKLLGRTYPLRVKLVLMYNLGTLLEAILSLIKSVVREKMQKRLTPVHDMVSVYDRIGQNGLPLEYLPDDYIGEHAGTCAELTENLVTELKRTEANPWTKLLRSGQFCVDETRMPPREELFHESFRKLDIQ